MKKIISFIILGSTFMLSAENVSAKTLRVGMETSYAPFEYYNDKNQLVGFDVDLAKQICSILKYKCEFKSLGFDTLIAALKMKRIDVAISGIDITVERAEQIDFSIPYYANSAQFISLKENNFTKINDLKGNKVGVQNGTTHQRYINDKYDEITTLNYADIPMAINDLKNGRIDAIFIDTAVADEQIAANDAIAKLDNKIVDATYFGSGLGVGIRMGNDKLKEKINAAITQMINDGSYQKLYDKWFAN